MDAVIMAAVLTKGLSDRFPVGFSGMWKVFFGISVVFFGAALIGPIVDFQKKGSLDRQAFLLMGILAGGWLVFSILATITSPSETFLMMLAKTCFYIGFCLMTAVTISGIATGKQAGFKSHVVLSIVFALVLGGVLTAIGYFGKQSL